MLFCKVKGAQTITDQDMNTCDKVWLGHQKVDSLEKWGEWRQNAVVIEKWNAKSAPECP